MLAGSPAQAVLGALVDPRLRFPRAAAKKTSLAKALNRMRTLFPSEFDFYPQTWTLPAQLESFRHHCDEAEKHGHTPCTTPTVHPPSARR